MKNKTEFAGWFKELWSRRRWLILAAAVFLSAFYELYELIAEPSFLKDPLHIVELVLQGVILPVVLLTLQRTETQKNAAINTLFLLESFVYQLNKTQSWEELMEIIIQFPRNIVPLRAIYLWIRLPNSNKFDLELERVIEPGFQKGYYQNSFDPGVMRCCQEGLDKNSGLRLCNCALQLQDGEGSAIQTRYCLPLSDTKPLPGMLHLYLPTSYKVSKDQKDFLESIVPEISLSIKESVLKRKSVFLEAAIETERLRLASDLHDTLGQDLAYLRNKIDELIRDNTFRGASRVRQELNQMRIVAEEANQTIRNILAVTHSNQGTPLDTRLLAYAKAIGERAKLDISLESQGQTQVLNPHMQFQIFLIFREILANIEKHANARQVMITLNWSDEELEMAISDDGRGFLTDHLDKNDHFGLTIIKTRTREMNGHMLVVSAPKEGTQVSIRLPINYYDGPLPSNGIENL